MCKASYTYESLAVYCKLTSFLDKKYSFVPYLIHIQLYVYNFTFYNLQNLDFWIFNVMCKLGQSNIVLI